MTKVKIPKYKKLFYFYRNQIEQGKFREGDVFYSENQLLKKHDVSRITIRHTLKLLQENGYISKSQGNQSVITNPKKFVWNLVDISKDLNSSPEDLTSIILSIDRTKPSAKIRDALKLNENDFVYRVERLRRLKGHHISRSISHIVPWIELDLTKVQFSENTSLTHLLRQAGQISTYCDESFEAINADFETANILNIKPSDAVFYRERVTYNQFSDPIEFVISFYNAKYTKYAISKSLL